METEHSIPVAADIALSAVHHAADSDEWIVFCHGFLSDKTGSYVTRCERAVEEGYNAVRFDFRGCGESDGEFIDQTLSSKIADLATVVEYFSLDAFVAFGSSFGGKVAFHAAATDERIRALGARAPVTYHPDSDRRRETIREHGVFEYDTGHRLDDRFFTDLDTYSFASIENEITCPVGIFHGSDDDSVPCHHSLRAADALTTDVFVQKYHGETHRFTRAAESRMVDHFFAWLRFHEQ